MLRRLEQLSALIVSIVKCDGRPRRRLGCRGKRSDSKFGCKQSSAARVVSSRATNRPQQLQIAFERARSSSLDEPARSRDRGNGINLMRRVRLPINPCAITASSATCRLGCARRLILSVCVRARNDSWQTGWTTAPSVIGARRFATAASSARKWLASFEAGPFRPVLVQVVGWQTGGSRWSAALGRRLCAAALACARRRASEHVPASRERR